MSGGVAPQRGPNLGRGVAAADADGRGVAGDAEPLGRERGAREGCAQVLFHVDGERLDRREIDHSSALEFGRDRFGHESVDGPEERRKGLTGSSRREDQRVVAGGDGRPAPRLGVGRCAERGGEPLAGRSREPRQRVHSVWTAMMASAQATSGRARRLKRAAVSSSTLDLHADQRSAEGLAEVVGAQRFGPATAQGRGRRS